MKNKTCTILLAGLILILMGCSTTMKVKSEYNEETNFADFKTYGLLRPGDMTEGYPMSLDIDKMQILENAIIKEMEDRGYTWAEKPDLQVSYYVKVDDVTRYSSMNYTTGGGSYLGPGYWGFYPGYDYGWTTVDIQAVDHKVGSLIIDVADVKNHKLVWYATGTKALEDDTGEPEYIQNIIHDIFKYYSFKAGSNEKVE
jgi:hypothetical protein